MSTRLIQVVAFVNVAPAGTVALPHDLNINGVAKKPDYVAADASGFTIAVTATQVSVTNNGAAPASVNIWLELKHSIPRELGALANLTPQPFVAAAGGGGGAPTQADALLTTELTNNDASPMIVGQAVNVNGTLASAATAATAQPIGLIVVGAAPGSDAKVAQGGRVVLTTAEWDAVTGEVGGLVPGDPYWLGDVAGRIQSNSAAGPGTVRKYIGTAVSTTELSLTSFLAGATASPVGELFANQPLFELRGMLNVLGNVSPQFLGAIRAASFGGYSPFSVIDPDDGSNSFLPNVQMGPASLGEQLKTTITTPNYNLAGGGAGTVRDIVSPLLVIGAAAAGFSIGGFRGRTTSPYQGGAPDFVAQPGNFFWLVNPGDGLGGGGNLTIIHEDAGTAVANNRCQFIGAANLVLPLNGAAFMIKVPYSPGGANPQDGNSRWMAAAVYKV